MPTPLFLRGNISKTMTGLPSYVACLLCCLCVIARLVVGPSSKCNGTGQRDKRVVAEVHVIGLPPRPLFIPPRHYPLRPFLSIFLSKFPHSPFSLLALSTCHLPKSSRVFFKLRRIFRSIITYTLPRLAIN